MIAKKMIFLNQLLLESKNNNLSHFLPLVNVPVTTGKSIISLKKSGMGSKNNLKFHCQHCSKSACLNFEILFFLLDRFPFDNKQVDWPCTTFFQFSF